MSEAFTMRLVVSGIFSLTVWFAVSMRKAEEESPERKSDANPRFGPYLFTCILPVYMIMWVPLMLLLHDWPTAWNQILSICVEMFPVISLFHCGLLLLLPLLRKWLSARSCALLWVVPNYLYLLTQRDYMEPERPLVILSVPARWDRILLFVWVAGFFTVLLWKCTQHLLLRHHLLKEAFPVQDAVAQREWKAELAAGGFNRNYPLLICPHIRSPLSIGFFQGSIRVLLPQRAYSPEELRLILRHELVHISRQDATTKFFLTFCTAMCWFNPLMWLAMERCAEDLELSCDETVLSGSDDQTRRRYAQLLLNIAGDSRGFTTCLSASAKALRRRLSGVLKPGKRLWGGFAVALAFFLVALGCGQVALAYSPTLVADVAPIPAEDFQDASCSGLDPYAPSECPQPEALAAYIGSLPVSRLTGSYGLQETEDYLGLFATVDGRRCFLQLRDQYLTVHYYRENFSRQQIYRVDREVDWNYIRSLFRA